MKKVLISILIFAILFACYSYFKTNDASNEANSSIVDSSQVVENDKSIINDTIRPEDSSVHLLTWNLYNIGKSKDSSELAYIANIIKDYDVIAIQEVSSSSYGPNAMQRLDQALEKIEKGWSFIVSEPTTYKETRSDERYAFFWKEEKLELDTAWLASDFADTLDREPFLARFTYLDNDFTLLSFHAVPKSKKPVKENSLMDDIHRTYENENFLLMGDFNQSESHYAFDDLKSEGYGVSITNQKTSLKMKPKDGVLLANEYDNIFWEISSLDTVNAGVIEFHKDFNTLKEARTISDHIPVFLEFTLKN